MAREQAALRRAPPFIDPPGYAQHRPEATLLYRLVEQHYPALLAAREATGRPLPGYVQEEFEAYLKCGRLEHGFLRVRCEDCHAEKLVAFGCKRRGFCPSCGARRMVESAALLGDPSAGTHACARHCVPNDLGPPSTQSTPDAGDGRNWGRHVDPALWVRPQSQHPLPHALSRRRVPRGHAPASVSSDRAAERA